MDLEQAQGKTETLKQGLSDPAHLTITDPAYTSAESGIELRQSRPSAPEVDTLNYLAFHG